MDHISDSFLETNVPLLVLIEAAKSGNEKEVKEYAQVFREHANKLVEVSARVISYSSLSTHYFPTYPILPTLSYPTLPCPILTYPIIPALSYLTHPTLPFLFNPTLQ